MRKRIGELLVIEMLPHTSTIKVALKEAMIQQIINGNGDKPINGDDQERIQELGAEIVPHPILAPSRPIPNAAHHPKHLFNVPLKSNILQFPFLNCFLNCDTSNTSKQLRLVFIG